MNLFELKKGSMKILFTLKNLYMERLKTAGY